MKIRNLIFFIFTLEWLIFILLTYFAYKILFGPELSAVNAYSSHVIYFFDWVIVLTLFLQLISLLIIHIIIFKRIDKINTSVKLPELSKEAISTKKSDELSAIYLKFKLMREAINKAHTYLEQRVQDRTQELESINAQLQQEISQHELTEREFIIHKEQLVKLFG